MFRFEFHWKVFPILLLQLTAFYVGAKGANILACISSASQSHHIIETTVLEELANRGHNVTVFSIFPAPKKKLPESYHHIYTYISDEKEWSNLRKSMLNNETKNEHNQLKRVPKILKIILQRSSEILKHEAVQKVLKSNQQFDLFILGYNLNDVMLGLAGHFRVPSVVISTIPAMKSLRDMIGNPAAVTNAPLFRPEKHLIQMGFRDRLRLFIEYTFEYFYVTYINYVYFEPFYNEHFGNIDNFPSFHDVKLNVSLVLTNSHFSEGSIRPTLPNLIEIGGVHIKEKSDPLPKNIQDILNVADDNGIIVFCFGGNIKSADMSAEKIHIFYKVFSKLKQKVIWKWESNVYPPEKPDNVYMVQWIPQIDLLAQPQVKVFISHCGAGGVYEAMYQGVPILGIPIYGDQLANAKQIKNLGWSITLDFDNLNETVLYDGILELLTNSTYKSTVQRLSQLFRDRPMTPLQLAIYWIEYVIRYDGAKHMQSPAVHLNFIQSNSIDVVLFFVIILYVAFKVIVKIVPIIIKYRPLLFLTLSIIAYLILPFEFLLKEK